jgi:hypothetical protein
MLPKDSIRRLPKAHLCREEISVRVETKRVNTGKSTLKKGENELKEGEREAR